MSMGGTKNFEAMTQKPWEPLPIRVSELRIHVSFGDAATDLYTLVIVRETTCFLIGSSLCLFLIFFPVSS